MTDVAQSDLPDIYGQILVSVAVGFMRFWGAEAASSRLNAALLKYRATPEQDTSSDVHGGVFEELAKIPHSSYEALSYVRDVSHLVYATTLLDTFLSDTTLFLLLVHPNAIGSKRQIPLATILNSTSIPDVLSEAAVRKAREVSFRTFADRLQYLRDTFGLQVILKDADIEALEHYSSIRNVAVHDQGVIDLRLDQQGILKAQPRACPHRPTKIDGEAVHLAAQCYRDVIGAVATSVYDQVLKAEHHPILSVLRDADA